MHPAYHPFLDFIDGILPQVRVGLGHDDAAAEELQHHCLQAVAKVAVGLVQVQAFYFLWLLRRADVVVEHLAFCVELLLVRLEVLHYLHILPLADVVRYLFGDRFLGGQDERGGAVVPGEPAQLAAGFVSARALLNGSRTAVNLLAGRTTSVLALPLPPIPTPQTECQSLLSALFVGSRGPYLPHAYPFAAADRIEVCGISRADVS